MAKKVQYLASEVGVQVSLIEASIGPQMLMLEHLSIYPWYMHACSSLDLPKERQRTTHKEPDPGISSTGLQGRTRHLSQHIAILDQKGGRTMPLFYLHFITH